MSQEVTPTSQVPDTPTNVTASVDAHGQVTLTWKSTYQASQYVVRPSPNAPDTIVSQTSATPTGLTPGQAYTFTVMAQSSTGAASNPSAPSNAVTPFTAPNPPKSPQADATSTTAVRVSWSAPNDNGSAITSYSVSMDGAARTTVGLATSHDFTGLASGQSHQFSVWATNVAGDSQPAYTTGTAGSQPQITSASASSDANSITVTYNVDWQGGPAGTCKLSVSGAGSSTGCGGSLSVNGLSGGTSYTWTLTASNTFGNNQKTGSKTTSTVGGVVVCDNTHGATYCGNVGLYSSPQQQGSPIAKEASGTRGTALCYVSGQSIYAYWYNNYKDSSSWIKVTIGGTTGYIPYAWFNLDGEPVGPWSKGNDVTPTAVPHC
jgi:hypothetical protein